ncbi:hypothetical protein L228DRAFT_240511 [Xylona heveae TC161]|uniref:Velvet domain-containing protein n=1 Tax=Xylona heveae (strain CBS 132557 / TC161) TaxID=1328760 RepID=A0A165FA17_XYLHT|nr:hypothetical protein L228DRAFT_240511 [Xylona heveae TC161]KZF20752.1 hypothetical protein L228DRAFT_240511 [Xylona heveae TC161]
MSGLVAVANEKMSSSSRVTKEGRKLTYQLNVIQQPERARACGSGAKSSADRRPVDPPPIVELRIFEGDAKNDVTFSYNANFFLFATLENARPIAQGRVPVTPASYPVLTGMPVAGMAYLDRPLPAGYFIFPDLSVRHEGKYRLSFNLFEEVKESKDFDMDVIAGKPDINGQLPNVSGYPSPTAHAYWRLEVKSMPFTVFSAKKFPGLAESTSLSRIVAEQGCRVRIRRDVRMRRRDGKAKDWDGYDEENAYVREQRRTATPDVYSQAAISNAQPLVDHQNRPRSVSIVSGDGQPAPYAMPPHRRPSVHEMSPYTTQPYQQAYPPAHVPPQPVPSAYPSHLAFGANPAPQYQAPHYSAPQPVAHPQPAALPPHTAPAAAYPLQPSAHVRQMSAPQVYGYAAPQQYAQPPYSQPVAVRQENLDYRRDSAPAPSSYASQHMPVYAAENAYSSAQPVHQPYATVPPPPAPTPASTTSNAAPALPPLKTLQPSLSNTYETNSPITATPGPISAASGSSLSGGYESAKSRAYSQYPTPHSASTIDSARSSKRPFGSVFSSAHLEKPLQDGMRPNTAHHGQDMVQADYDEEEFDMYDMQALRMRYKRADGTEISRRAPLSG